MTLILHIARQDRWAEALTSGSYRADTLETQGFIHCSFPDPLIPVADHLFRGPTDLVLLCIDRAKGEAEIRDENPEGGDTLFPDIYDPLNVSAVADIPDFHPQPDGRFTLPDALKGENQGGRM